MPYSPVHENSKLLFRHHAVGFFPSSGRVLEIGPDALPSSYDRLVGKSGLQWDTLDLADRPGLTYRARGEYEFPIPDGTYDVVVSGQVLEHVRKAWRWIREVARVVRPGGHVITVSPVTWPYHEAPVDCWRIYPEGMRALYDEGGLQVLHCSVESLEPRALLPRLPWPQDERAKGLLYKVARLLRYPMGRVYDTITIGRKPDSDGPGVRSTVQALTTARGDP
jgi:SAM-dependent methyltransferase